MSLKMVVILANGADCNEMLPYAFILANSKEPDENLFDAAVNLDLHCLPK